SRSSPPRRAATPLPGRPWAGLWCDVASRPSRRLLVGGRLAANLERGLRIKGERDDAAVHGRAPQGTRGNQGDGRRGRAYGRREDAGQVRRAVPPLLVRREKQEDLLPGGRAERRGGQSSSQRGAWPGRGRDLSGDRGLLAGPELAVPRVPAAGADVALVVQTLVAGRDLDRTVAVRIAEVPHAFGRGDQT